MKKYTCLMVLLLSAILLLACQNEAGDTKVEESKAETIETTQEIGGTESTEPKAESLTLYQNKYPLPAGVEEEDVYELFQDTAEVLYEVDVSFPAIASHSDVIALCKVILMEKVNLGENWPTPSTSYVVEVMDVLKGEENKKEINIVYGGGFVPVAEVNKNYAEDPFHTIGAELSEEEKEKKVIGLFLSNYQTVMPGETYVFFLNKTVEEGNDNQDDYYVIGDGHGVFSYDEKANQYCNDVQKQHFTLEELKE